MPNRIIRDWTDSENVDALDVNAERFFTRLIMKVDDFGRYSANTKLLKSHLFPLKSDIRETDITRWIAACEKSGLIVTYSVARKEYLQIDNFKQQLRQKTEKYPSPDRRDDDATHVSSSCVADAVLNRIEEKKKPEEEGRPAADTHTQEEKDLFKAFQAWLTTNAPRVNEMKQKLTIEEYVKLRKKLDAKKLRTLLLAMQNYKPLLTKSVSAYLTILNWAKREHFDETTSVPDNTKLSNAVKQINASGN